MTMGRCRRIDYITAVIVDGKIVRWTVDPRVFGVVWRYMMCEARFEQQKLFSSVGGVRKIESLNSSVLTFLLCEPRLVATIFSKGAGWCPEYLT